LTSKSKVSIFNSILFFTPLTFSWICWRFFISSYLPVHLS
jgi:hypothetical protein